MRKKETSSNSSQNDIKELVSEVKSLTKEIQQLKNRLEQSSSSLDRCHERLDELVNAQRTSDARLERIEQRGESWAVKLQAFERTVADGQAELAVMKAENSQLREELEKVKQSADFISDQHDELKKTVYKGLDVVTAKATAAERALAPHHLLDILEPHQNFTVVDFRNRALKIIQELTEKGKIPIVIGGTNYYMESIVYNILVEEESDSVELLWNRSTRKRDIDDAGPSNDVPNAKNPALDTNNENNETSAESNKVDSKTKPPIEITDEIDKEKVKYEVDNERLLTNEDIHLRLMTIDPVMAERLHPNNRRKMLRSIEVWLKTGRRHSEILEEQKQREGCLRRPGATIVLWLRCEQKIHDERLDNRVDAMLEQGLIGELLDFHQRHNKQRLKDGKPPDYTRGIFQTLGFKEFHDYLMLSEDERQGRPELLQQSIENMKMGTRRYARRQNKMVKGRFLEHPNREVPPIYELDTTDISAWDTKVKEKAIEIIESYLNGSPCKYDPLTSDTKEAKKDINPFSNNYCEVCKRVLIGDKEYGIHLKSNKHMKVLKKRKLEEKKRLESQTDSDNVNF